MGSGLILAAEVKTFPWPHIEIDGLLRDESVRFDWPTDGFQYLKHSDITKDGISLRKYWRLKDVCPWIADELLTDEIQDAFKRTLSVEGDLYPQALLVEDAPGYKIRRHTDCNGKVITCQIYLAEDDEHHEQGVILCDRHGTNPKQIPYAFNHAYAFKVTTHSWHRVYESKTRRRSIQLIYYNVPNPVI